MRLTKRDPHSLQHLPCLSKSSFSPYFFPSTCLFFQSCSPQTEVTSSPQQQCAAIAIQLPMHGTWDFNLQYVTLHYSAHYMQRAIPILERTPCRKFLHRCRNFKLYSLVVTASHSFLHRFVAPNRWKWRFWFPGGNEIVTETLDKRSDNSDSL